MVETTVLYLNEISRPDSESRGNFVCLFLYQKFQI